jgi:uncharacterized protein
MIRRPIVHNRMIHPSQLFRNVLCIVALAAVVVSCTSGPPRKGAAQAQEQALELLARGDRRDAAALWWEQAASQPSPQREDLQLRAVEAVLTRKTALLAKHYLNIVLNENLRGSLLVRARMAQARLALIEEQPAAALAALPKGISLTTPEFQAQVDELRAQALLGVGKILPSVRTRVLLATELTDRRAINADQQKLWRALGQAGEQQVFGWIQGQTNPVLRGWLELAYIAMTSPADVETFNRALDVWWQRYPGHPAREVIVGQLRHDWKALQVHPHRIAVLLPLTGAYAAVAGAVMDGFMAAYYTDRQTPRKPSIRVYDVGEGSAAAWEQYRRAVKEGAQLVVGPLDKEGVAALAGRKKLPVPVLSLNYTEEISQPPDNLYEFGLLPEDEARQAAERARLAGYQTALILAPTGKWGGRLLNAFSKRFEELGGQVLDVDRYDPEGTDFSAPITDVLGIDASEQREAELQSLLNREIHFEPRRRPDAGMLFMAALPRQARLLRPQLEFQYASDLPVYATSHIYTGIEDVRSDRDIDGVVYCDMPWMLNGANPEPALRARLNDLFPQDSQQLARLTALGYDAYRVIYYLKRLAKRPYERYEGLTGTLHMDSLGRIHRELEWARFIDGEPSMMHDIAAQPAPDTIANAP